MQVVGYDQSVPALLVSDDDGLDRVELTTGQEISYSLGDRHCAGTIHEGQHLACGATKAPHCQDHSHVWVCARCTGECLKDEMDCYDTHAVYLAAFAPDVFKVGVTRAERLETRLREQGADRGAHIRTVSNGRIAREIEAGLAAEIPDRVRVPTKREGLHRSVDEGAWNQLLEEFDVIDRYQFSHGLDLADQPMDEVLAAGTVQGTQGRLLVLDKNKSSYAIDMRELVGFELQSGSHSRNLQSSLGSF